MGKIKHKKEIDIAVVVEQRNCFLPKRCVFLQDIRVDGKFGCRFPYRLIRTASFGTELFYECPLKMGSFTVKVNKI